MGFSTKVKRMLDEATPLPWRLDGPWFSQQHGEPSPPYWSVNTLPQCIVHKAHRQEDAALIVHAVNRLPDYEAAVDALEGLVKDSPMEFSPELRAILRRLRGEE